MREAGEEGTASCGKLQISHMGFWPQIQGRTTLNPVIILQCLNPCLQLACLGNSEEISLTFPLPGNPKRHNWYKGAFSDRNHLCNNGHLRREALLVSLTLQREEESSSGPRLSLRALTSSPNDKLDHPQHGATEPRTSSFFLDRSSRNSPQPLHLTCGQGRQVASYCYRGTAATTQPPPPCVRATTHAA